MKRILTTLFCIITFYGCYKDDLATINDTEYHNEATTRAAITGDYYWGSDGRIPITKSTDKVWVLFKEDNNTVRTSSQTTGISLLQDIQDYNLVMHNDERSTLKFANLKSGIGEIQYATSLSNLESVVYVAPYYKFKSEKEYPLTNIFYVELKSSNDLCKLEELAAENNVTVIGEIPLTGNAYILACTKDSNGNALEMANLFYESGIFISSVPEFMSATTETVNDMYFPQQWNLNNLGQIGITGIDINYCNAHSLTSGSEDIVIAVIDSGVPINHPDLNVSFIHDANTQTDTQIIYGNHGIACAGIISAQANNGIGIAGIAPNCKLMSISTNLSVAAVTYAIRYAADNGADIISNSWGNEVDMPTVNTAIKYALQNGRNGKGCVVVFSAGNDNASCVNYPKEADPDIIVVGAMSPSAERKSPTSSDGEYWWGSNYGTALDVMAPGVLIYTTDLLGVDGYEDDSDYTPDFHGTSSACPHVAGIAGLILSMNPNLTQKQVAHAIETTARKLGNYDYALTLERENGTWNNEMGYGLVDAYAAVLAGSSCFPYISNRIYMMDSVVNGCEINTTNITVSGRSTLTLQAPKVVINPSLYIQSGASLVITPL